MILDYWRQIVGPYVDYFTFGQGQSIQWHYGKLLEYAMVALAVIVAICLVFKFIFYLFKLFFK